MKVLNGDLILLKIVRHLIKFFLPFIFMTSKKKEVMFACILYNVLFRRFEFISMKSKDGNTYCFPFLSDFSFFINGVDYKKYGESNLFPIIQKYVNSGDTVIEVGSSWGQEVAYLSALVGPEGKVFCFEPNPKSFFALKRNNKKNGFKNVTSINAAIGNCEGRLKVENRIWERSTSIENNTNIIDGFVKVIRLDDYFQDYQCNIAFLKIDTDGFDYEVLKGSENLIKKHDPGIILEFLPSIEYSNMKGEEVLKAYKSLGYVPHAIRKNYEEIPDFKQYLKNFGDSNHDYTHDLFLKRR